MTICQRCGRCCITSKGKNCKYLVIHNDGKDGKRRLTSCRIYKSNKREGIDIGDNSICTEDTSKWFFKDCPKE